MRAPATALDAAPSPSSSGLCGSGYRARTSRAYFRGARAARNADLRSKCHVVCSAARRKDAGLSGSTRAQAVAGPAREATATSTPSMNVQAAAPASHVSIDLIRAPVKEDVEILNENLRNVVGQRHPMLMAAADQIFGAGGKKMRPILCFLVARATQAYTGNRDINERQRRLAEITEMIHVASLVHDDVLDDCGVRRGAQTVNALYGTRVAVLVGDFLFAQSSWGLAQLDNLEVIKLISQVIADFADGEISQAQSLFNCDITLDEYLDKSFYKTASLIAASCRSAAVFSDVPEDVKEAMFQYGKHLGLAFQVVDDILDFEQSTEVLGKPQGQDLASGNLTAPAIFALQAEGGERLREIIESEFQDSEDDLETALGLVKELGGLTAARQLASQEGDKALRALECLPQSPAKESLVSMVDWVLERLH